MIVYLDRQYPEDFFNEFSPRLHHSISVTSGELTDHNRNFDILISGVPPRELLTASSKLKALVIPWAGLPKATRDLMADYPHVPVYNLHHNATATAELGIALLLAAARELIPIDRALRNGDWSPRYQDPTALQLEGRHAVILGLGAIGQKVAASCLALNMRVTGVNRTGESVHTESLVDLSRIGYGDFNLISINHLDSALKDAHALILCLPLTAETTGIIGHHQLAMLAHQAIVVNVSRGPVVDQAALYEQLRSGRLRAGIDVWYQYPPDEASRSNTRPSFFPFDELDNVIMTPHLAAHTTSTELYRARELAWLLNALAGHGTPPTPIDLDRGY